ncbi:MAG: ROK family protein [Spirochaetota bacterium]
MQQAEYIGIDVGGGSLRASLVTKKGTILAENKLATEPSWDNQAFCEALAQLVEPLTKTKNNYQAIGIGTPGPIDIDKGEIVASGNLANLKHTPLVSFLTQQFSVPVSFNNDANCAALGEYHFGSGKNCPNLVVLTLGTGLGCGWVQEGELYNGWKGNGMEIGHTTVQLNGEECSCGQRGCAEAYFSASGFLRRMKKETGRKLDSAEKFFQLVRQNDEIAQEIFSEGLEALAALVRNLSHSINPEKIILVGGLTASADLILPYLKKRQQEIIFPVLAKRLELQIGGKVAGTLGAAALCFSKSKK